MTKTGSCPLWRWRFLFGEVLLETPEHSQSETAGKQHEQSRHPALAPWTSYLAGLYFPKVAPVRNSTAPVKPVELAPRGQSKKLLACTMPLASRQGMPWHEQHMSCLPASNKSFVPKPHASQIGCLFLGLYGCRNQASSFPLLRERFMLIGMTTLLDLQDLRIRRR